MSLHDFASEPNADADPNFLHPWRSGTPIPTFDLTLWWPFTFKMENGNSENWWLFVFSVSNMCIEFVET